MRLLLSQGTLLTLVVVEAVLALHLEGVLAVDAGPAGRARTAANEGRRKDEFMVSGFREWLMPSRLGVKLPLAKCRLKWFKVYFSDYLLGAECLKHFITDLPCTRVPFNRNRK